MGWVGGCTIVGAWQSLGTSCHLSARFGIEGSAPGAYIYPARKGGASEGHTLRFIFTRRQMSIVTEFGFRFTRTTQREVTSIIVLCIVKKAPPPQRRKKTPTRQYK